MASIRFYPEKRKQAAGLLIVRNVPLLLFFHFEGKRLQLYTGERINLSDWDAVNQQVLPNHPSYREINRYLEFLSARVMQVYRDSKLQGGGLSVKQLNSLLKESLKKPHYGFFDALIRFIEENHGRWTLATYRKVKTLYNHLHAFSVETGQVIEFERIDNGFLDSLVHYFRQQCRHIDSTIRKNLEVLYWFLNWAEALGTGRNQALRNYLHKEFLVRQTPQEVIFLNREELTQLRAFVPAGKRDALVQDVFCLICYTGLRINELKMMKPEHIQADMLFVESRKSSRRIPLSKPAADILQKYIQQPGKPLFPMLYGHRINHSIKRIGSLAGITREISLSKQLSGKEKLILTPLYNLLTVSLARKTFLYLSFQLGFNEIALMDIAGYRQVKTIEGYKKKLESVKKSDMGKFNDV